MTIPNGSGVACIAAPRHDRANPDRPCRSLQGAKRSELIAAAKPARSAARTQASSRLGGNCSCEAWYPIVGMLRRRLAPMLGGDRARLRLADSVLFGLPGTPMLFYGEEIGMGENPELPGRLSVRTPMQRTPYENGGFSDAASDRFVRAMPDGEYGFDRISVGAQRGDRGSLLNWMAALIRARRERSEIGAGAWRVIDTGEEAVLGLRYDLDDSAAVVLNNFSPRPCAIGLDLPEHELRAATDLFADRPYDPLAERGGRMRLPGYGYRWLRLGGIY